MSRKLLALNLALAVLLVAAGWRLWTEIDSAGVRESAVSGQPLEPAVVPPSSPVAPPDPLLASDYFAVAQQLLFFADRNPEVIIAAAPPKPLPPMPYAHGILDIGSGPTLILSKSPEAAQQGYRVGDSYADFRIVDIGADSVVFEWEGERIRRTIEELMPEEGSVPVAQAKPASAPTKPAKPSSAVLGEAAKATPSDVEMGGGIRACRPGDTSPPGTVSGGYKKVVTKTPFGNVCRWEQAQ